MNPSVQAETGVLIVSCALALGLFLFTFSAHRKGLFTETYSILWLGLSLSILAVPLFWRPLYDLLRSLGFATLTSFLFLCGILASFAIIMLLSIHVSKLRKQVIRLSQMIACEHTTRKEQPGNPN